MNYLSILRQYWGYDNFRGIQKEIIESIGSGKDTLGLMPTGGGKSITFQVPALAKEGTCLVVSPLIALMKDQVQHLVERGIRAQAIYSGMSRQEIIVALENCVLGNVKLLYVSPERLASDLFLKKLSHMRISFITVDEAHCISQWGYDFRPSYLQIAQLRHFLVKRGKPKPPILALTATATPKVIGDIQDKLEFEQKNVFRMSFERKNLAYVVRAVGEEKKQLETLHILNSVEGSAIVYTRNRKGSKEIAKFLNENGISASFFHAGLDHAVRDQRQQQWQTGETRVICATNAFGMGIDKANVRIVIHIDCPDSIEAYFQEAGRAGRDGQKAYAVLLYDEIKDTTKLRHRIKESFPPKEFIKKVYEDLASFFQIGAGSGKGYTFNFSIEKFCFLFKHFPTQTDGALKLLMQAGYLHYETNPDSKARLMFLIERDDLYRLKDTSPNEDAIMKALLRLYTGLFTDYAFINLEMIALQTSLDREQVYLNLTALSQRHILHFIPAKNTPYITYTRNRAPSEFIIIPPEVYEQRLEQYTKRIDAVLSYANNNHICRSTQLLHYFGEDRNNKCKQCDVCLKSNARDRIRFSPTAQAILDFLADGSKHKLYELMELPLPHDKVKEAVQFLISEEMVHLDHDSIYREVRG